MTKKQVNNQLLKKFKQLSSVILVLVLVFTISACSKNSQDADNTVAVIKDTAITQDDIDNALKQQEARIVIAGKLQQEGETQQPRGFNEVVASRGFDPASLTKEQERYFQRVVRGLEQNYVKIDANQAFNQLVQYEVLYQEAVKQGFKVSLEEAAKTQEQIEKASREIYEKGGIWQEIYQLETEAAQEMGYTSREEWLKAVIPRQAQKASITRLKQKFEEELGRNNPTIQGFDYEILKANAWEDYTEDLVKKAGVKIKKTGYSLVFYGK